MNKLPAKFMVSSSDGNLYDITKPNWASNPVRTNYSQHHTKIASVADMKASLRAGPNAWPGGYPVLFVTSDGGLLCSALIALARIFVPSPIASATEFRMVGKSKLLASRQYPLNAPEKQEPRHIIAPIVTRNSANSLKPSTVNPLKL